MTHRHNLCDRLRQGPEAVGRAAPADFHDRLLHGPQCLGVEISLASLEIREQRLRDVHHLGDLLLRHDGPP